MNPEVIAIIVIVLVMDTVISFVALYLAITNKASILKNRLQILLNTKNIFKVLEKSNSKEEDQVIY